MRSSAGGFSCEQSGAREVLAEHPVTAMVPRDPRSIAHKHEVCRKSFTPLSVLRTRTRSRSHHSRRGRALPHLRIVRPDEDSARRSVETARPGSYARADPAPWTEALHQAASNGTHGYLAALGEEGEEAAYPHLVASRFAVRDSDIMVVIDSDLFRQIEGHDVVFLVDGNESAPPERPEAATYWSVLVRGIATPGPLVLRERMPEPLSAGERCQVMIIRVRSVSGHAVPDHTTRRYDRS